MNMPDEFSDRERGASWAPSSFGTSGGTRYRVQSVPSASALINSPGGRGIAWDRLRLWRDYADRYREAIAIVGGSAAAQSAAARAGSIRSNDVGVLADLAAVHLYLTSERRNLDEALSEGAMDGLLSLARCVASGLRRLPAFRGPATVRTNTVGPVADWFRENRFVTEQAFWTASASAAALDETGPGFVVWSLTARLTKAVDPSAPDQLIFLPGTRFKVLRVMDGLRPLVLLREMFPPEPESEGHANDADRQEPTWLDASTLEELERMTSGPETASSSKTPESSTIAYPWNRPPGLIVKPGLDRHPAH